MDLAFWKDRIIFYKIFKNTHNYLDYHLNNINLKLSIFENFAIITNLEKIITSNKNRFTFWKNTIILYKIIKNRHDYLDYYLNNISLNVSIFEIFCNFSILTN